MGNVVAKESIVASLKKVAALPTRDLAKVAVVAIALSVWSLKKKKKPRRRAGDAPRKKKKAKVDKAFVKVLLSVLRRGFGTREYLNLGALSASLLARTVLSVWIAQNMGASVKFLCSKQWDRVANSIFSFGRNTIAAALVNAALKYYTSLLAQNLRDSLTKKVHAMYMKDMNYYKANFVGTTADRLENADQLICEDIQKFSQTFADVYSQSLKPLVDVVVFSIKLGQKLGIEGPGGMYTWFFVATALVSKVVPNYRKLKLEEQVLEGRFRGAHANLIGNSEMVAFMGGEEPELAVLQRAYGLIRKLTLRKTFKKFWADFVAGYLNKYFATVVGFSFLARPVFVNFKGMGSWNQGEIAQYFVEARRLMENTTTAVTSLFELQEKVGTLNGLATRVNDLCHRLEHRKPVLTKEIAEHESNPPVLIQDADLLKFDKVDIYKPDGVLLLKELRMEIEAGGRVMITGDNGCGKSSLFRVIRGLWPLVGGTLHRPKPSDMYFLSQVNFVPLGCLRDVIIYPHSKSQKPDSELEKILHTADLSFKKLAIEDEGMDAVRNWGTALSPGQKQRMAFARLFYHHPRIAVLDECTNGINPDTEDSLYRHCTHLGMSVFSISHKEALKMKHQFELHFGNDESHPGSWEWSKLLPDGKPEWTWSSITGERTTFDGGQPEASTRSVKTQKGQSYVVG